MAKKKLKDLKVNFNTSWEYAPAPESQDHVKINDRYDLFINGRFTAPQSGKYFDTINPATEKKIRRQRSFYKTDSEDGNREF